MDYRHWVLSGRKARLTRRRCLLGPFGKRKWQTILRREAQAQQSRIETVRTVPITKCVPGRRDGVRAGWVGEGVGFGRLRFLIRKVPQRARGTGSASAASNTYDESQSMPWLGGVMARFAAADWEGPAGPGFLEDGRMMMGMVRDPSVDAAVVSFTDQLHWISTDSLVHPVSELPGISTSVQRQPSAGAPPSDEIDT
ncbi:hypothetical protein G7046_g7352 [Stylonectria norvegica]|nr:hypothetical protein G7046_g7352 [Stylonectria norvegica]